MKIDRCQLTDTEAVDVVIRVAPDGEWKAVQFRSRKATMDALLGYTTAAQAVEELTGSGHGPQESVAG